MYNPFADLIQRIEYLSDQVDTLIKQSRQKPIKEPYTRQTAAKRLGVSVPMIDKLVRSGRLKKIKVGSKALVPFEEVEKYYQQL